MKMVCRPVLICLLLIGSVVLWAQDNAHITGKVSGDDFRPLSGATIYISGFSNGAVTNDKGEFIIEVPKGKQEIAFSFVGYEPLKIQLVITRDTSFEIILKTATNIAEVTVLGQKVLHNISQSGDGTMILQRENIDKLPAIGGEKDPIKAVQMLPGVQSGNEGLSGIFIRGGSPDQNLILLDGVTIFNPAHLYGFVSVFNADAVSSISLYKNSYPARYGGRLTSVIDVEANHGDTSKLKGLFSVGFITSHLHLEGPFKNHKTTFSLSVRGCYVGLLTSPLSGIQFKKSNQDGNITYYFYDVNAGITHHFDDKNELSAGFFMNEDRYRFFVGSTRVFPLETDKLSAIRQVNWRNIAASVNYKSKFSSRVDFKEIVGFSNYTLYNGKNSSYLSSSNNGSSFEDSKQQQTTSYVDELSSKTELDVKIDKYNSLKGGIELIYRLFQTGTGSVTRTLTFSDTTNNSFKDDLLKAGDMSAYTEYDFHPSKHFNVNFGLRFNDYFTQNKNYIAILPRVSVVYTPVKEFGMRGSFASGNQNIHLLTSSQTDISMDYWVPATARIAPQSGWQASGGFFGKFSKMFEWSIDGFYKDMTNVIEFKEGSSFETSGKNWENQVVANGKGKAYGAEFYFAKNVGRLTAQAAYTLAWSMRQFADLNQGRPFAYKYDRRHNIALMANYDVNEHWSVGASWIYGSGNMYTLPVQFYDSWGGNSYLDYQLQAHPTATPKPIELLTIYSQRNNYRLPAYHHLDITCNYKKVGKRAEHQVNVTIYNVYSRQNVFSIYTDYRLDDKGNRTLYLKQLSLFPILPSLTYTISFSS